MQRDRRIEHLAVDGEPQSDAGLEDQRIEGISERVDASDGMFEEPVDDREVMNGFLIQWLRAGSCQIHEREGDAQCIVVAGAVGTGQAALVGEDASNGRRRSVGGGRWCRRLGVQQAGRQQTAQHGAEICREVHDGLSFS
jgi:hypothetical protein